MKKWLILFLWSTVLSAQIEEPVTWETTIEASMVVSQVTGSSICALSTVLHKKRINHFFIFLTALIIYFLFVI